MKDAAYCGLVLLSQLHQVEDERLAGQVIVHMSTGAGGLVYANTKLAVTLFSFDLAKRVKGNGITVNAADPGVVNTKIIHLQNKLLDPLADIFFRPFIRTPRQGAETAIRLMFDAENEGQTGTFCRSNKVVKLGDKYIHHKQMQELWDETEKIVQNFLE